ncbi:MAG: NUDIX hydrolase [Armatimonadota bacterium]|nr:NUDIX hydrolase [Armatimonadota bacterium]
MSKEENEMPVPMGEEMIYAGRILNLKQIKLQMPGGAVVQREIVEHHGSVGILPITEDGHFILVKQYRAPTGTFLLELPAGSIEPGEAPHDAALRELAEEIGQTAASMHQVAGFYLATGWATEFMHGFIATGLSPHEAECDEDEQIELILLTPQEALDAITHGEILDCKSVALIGMYFAEKYRQLNLSETV